MMRDTSDTWENTIKIQLHEAGGYKME